MPSTINCDSCLAIQVLILWPILQAVFKFLILLQHQLMEFHVWCYSSEKNKTTSRYLWLVKMVAMKILNVDDISNILFFLNQKYSNLFNNTWYIYFPSNLLYISNNLVLFERSITLNFIQFHCFSTSTCGRSPFLITVKIIGSLSLFLLQIWK